MDGVWRCDMIRTIVTDDAVITVSLFRDIGVDELWIVFGKAKHFGLLSINGLSNVLGNKWSHTLIVINAFTGCDTVLSLLGKKKDCVGVIDFIWRCDFNIKNDDWSTEITGVLL